MNRLVVALAIGFAAVGGVHAPSADGDVLPAADARVELFGSVSGFAKARTDRITIMVGPIPSSSEVDLGIVLGEWNRAAGWNLYGLAESDATADVTFHSDRATTGEATYLTAEGLRTFTGAADACPNSGACVGWDQFDSGWYEHCYVMIWPWEMDPNTIEHELGHCLGFVDVEHGSDPYHGIMSYARDRSTLTLGEQDIASLADVGYRDAS